MPTTIYALCEPDLRVPVIRYIGKTVALRKRFRQHLRQSIEKHTHLGSWLKGLRNRGEKPVLLTLTEVPDEIGSAAEMLYIRLAREGGMDLVNGNDGGSGGQNPSPETRRKISVAQKGKKRGSYTPVGRAKRKAALLSKIRRPHTSETRAKMSAAQKGRKLDPRPPAHCAAISAAQQGKKRGPYKAKLTSSISSCGS